MLLKNNAKAWIGLTVLLLLLLFAGKSIYDTHFQRELKIASKETKKEMELILILIEGRLQKQDYQLAKSFILNWGEIKPEVAEISLTMKNGFELAHYNSSQTTTHKLVEVADIAYSYGSLATLKLHRSIDNVYLSQKFFMYQLLAGYFFIAVILYFLVYINLRTQKQREELIYENKQRKEVEKKLQKATYAAETASIAKSNFLASMSHEIRTPMTAMVGMVEILSDSPLNDDQRYALQVLKRSNENLLALIDDILDLAKIEAKHLDLEKVEFNLKELLFEIASFMGTIARGKGLELSYYIEPDVPVDFIGDPKRLRQIIFNLVSNAIKFTQKGRVDINVSKRGAKGDITELEFYVKDRGIGIPSDKIDIIFEEFTQADSSTTRKFGGTGLGTSISKFLVEAMEGSIWVESELGKGSTFYFTVKLKRSKTAKKMGNTKKKEVISWEGPLNILVVEDSEDNLILMKMHFKETPHIVDIAENGKVAVEKFKTANYDLVLMDMEMPIMDGYTATKEIRKWESKEKKRPTPVVALTAHAMKEHKKNSMDAGCTAYLTKPFKKQAFLEAIYKYGSNS